VNANEKLTSRTLLKFDIPLYLLRRVQLSLPAGTGTSQRARVVAGVGVMAAHDQLAFRFVHDFPASEGGFPLKRVNHGYECVVDVALQLTRVHDQPVQAVRKTKKLSFFFF